MFKLLVLSAIVALAAAAPSHLPLAYSSAVVIPEVHHAVAIPAAVSHQSRVDYHTKPIVTSYVAHAPLVHAAPVVHAAPYVHSAVPAISLTTGHAIAHAAPLSYGHSSYSVHGSPLVHSW